MGYGQRNAIRQSYGKLQASQLSVFIEQSYSSSECPHQCLILWGNLICSRPCYDMVVSSTIKPVSLPALVLLRGKYLKMPRHPDP